MKTCEQTMPKNKIEGLYENKHILKGQIVVSHWCAVAAQSHKAAEGVEHKPLTLNFLSTVGTSALHWPPPLHQPSENNTYSKSPSWTELNQELS